jgi:uncharacterized protein YgiM (DUF1202 family)
MFPDRASVVGWVGLVVCGLGVCGLGIAEESAKTEAGEQALTASYIGEVTGNNVYVRSGPSENYYPVTRLSAGARVTVVDEENGWLGIVPPEGCFSLVDATYVDRDRQGPGVVNGQRVNVRAGSELSRQKYAIQLQLDKGAEVAVLGEEEDGFLRIAPPPGAKLWISGDFVQRVPEALLNLEAEARTSGVETTPSEEESIETAGTPPVTGGSAAAKPDAAKPAPRPIDLSRTPAERQAEVKRLRDRLEDIESQLREEMTKPMFTRDLAGLAEQYRPLGEQELDEYTRQYARARIEQLDNLVWTLNAVRRVHELKGSVANDRRDFAAERAKIRTVPVEIGGGFDAQGELRESAIYNSPVGPRRYRLIDPASNTPRTLCYVEIPPDSDLDVTRYLGRIVGVRARAKYVSTEGVDPVPIVLASEFVLLEQGEPALTEAAGPPSDQTAEPSTDQTADAGTEP